MASLISSISWIPRGAAARHPSRYALDDAELERVGKLAGRRLQEVRKEMEEAGFADEAEAGDDEWEDESTSASGAGDEGDGDVEMADGESKTKDPHDLTDYKLEGYDEEPSRGIAAGPFSNVKGLQYYDDPSEDPYITLKGGQGDEEEDEREELEVYPTDSMLVAARTEANVSQLDVYVYDDGQENLYVHHDLLLPAMPLCLEWLDFAPAGVASSSADRRGNFVAVGTMDPDIEVWSLDVVDGMYPDAILGGSTDEPVVDAVEEAATEKKKKKKKKKHASASDTDGPTILPTRHSDAILGLSHNRLQRNLLLSASADTTVKLWDLNLAPSASSSSGAFQAAASYELHTDKVQSVQWCPSSSTTTLTGGWDACVRVWDTRTPTEGVGVHVDGDVECIRWDPFDEPAFLVASETGLVQKFDARKLAKAGARGATTPKGRPVWTLAAHDGAVAAMDVSAKVEGCFVTGGTDKQVKVWNVEKGKQAVSKVASRDLGVGKVFSAGFCPDDPTMLAVAGSKATLQLWDLGSDTAFRTAFADRVKSATGLDVVNRRKGRGQDGVLGLANDDESDESDEE